MPVFFSISRKGGGERLKDNAVKAGRKVIRWEGKVEFRRALGKRVQISSHGKKCLGKRQKANAMIEKGSNIRQARRRPYRSKGREKPYNQNFDIQKKKEKKNGPSIVGKG